MSLVEQALKKLQQARDAGAAARPNAPRRCPAHRGRDPLAQTMPTRVVVPQRSLNMNPSALRAAGFLRAGFRRSAASPTNSATSSARSSPTRWAAAAAKIQNGRLIMVTSSLPGDGKTFTSINLAMSMAQEMDLNVLLVDADVAKRHISRLLGVEGERGLLDVLRDETADIDRSRAQHRRPGPVRAAGRQAFGERHRAAGQSAHGTGGQPPGLTRRFAHRAVRFAAAAAHQRIARARRVRSARSCWWCAPA